MGKRKDHHKIIIQEALLQLPLMKVTQFHTAQKMPRKLRGVPDLNLLFADITFWIEIKPRYANYMRDQMSDLQFQWIHERKDHMHLNTRYAIVEDAKELVDVVQQWVDYPAVWMGEYHQGRYENWRRGR